MVGIYYITNTINNKIYIGSSNNIEKRHKDHFRNLRLGNHSNKHLQSAVTKYGLDNFSFKAIELCEREDLLIIEQEHIDNYDNNLLYNLTYVTTGGGSDVLAIPVYALNLLGDILYTFTSISEASRYFNTAIGSTMSVNTGSICVKKYRIVTIDFYNNNISLIKSWSDCANPKMKALALKHELFHKERIITVITNGLTVDYATNEDAATALNITKERVRQLLLKPSKKYAITFKYK
jgi:group I intron endonuclease